MPAESPTKQVGKTAVPMKYNDCAIERGGTKIILPPDMSYSEGREWLTRKEEAEEKRVGLHYEIPCYPLDGIICLCKAMEQVYGFTALKGFDGWFGEEPPLIVQVADATGRLHSAPLGKIQAPTWEGGYMSVNVQKQPTLFIGGEIKRKHEPEVKRVITLAQEMLKTDSIYKGQAIVMDLSWMDNGPKAFDPIQCAPQFMNVKDIIETDLILSATTEFELRTNVWMLLEKTEACVANGIPLKQGVLLKGPYGVGKTLTAKVTAEKATRNGWTFIYLKDVAHVAKALKLAELYAPAVVFAEDVDSVTENRDAKMNEILNTLDGVDTKGKPIVTILTTNNAEKIDPSFLRAGRIDTVIHMGTPDNGAAQRFVQLYSKDDDARSLLVPGMDLFNVGEALMGYVPAFIAEAVQKAKRAAIYREGEDIVGKVQEKDLLVAAAALKIHAAMAEPKKEKSYEETVVHALRLVQDAGSGTDSDVTCPECDHEFTP